MADSKDQTSDQVPQKKKSRSGTTAERNAYLLKLYVLLGLIAILLIALLFLTPDRRAVPELSSGTGEAPRSDDSGERGQPEPDFEEPLPSPPARLPDPVPTPQPERQPETPEAPAPEPIPPVVGDLYLILDDAGYSLWELEPFLELDVPLTVSVLPHLQFSFEAAEATYRAGHDVMLHMPMQALGRGDPGPGAIEVTHQRDEIALLVQDALDSVPHVVAANNHMGSAVTEQLHSMQTIIDVLHEQGVFFLDSRTTAQTVVAEAGDTLGIQTIERHIFVDHYRDTESMRNALLAGIERARSQGYAVLIGHVQTRELPQLIREAAEFAETQGVAFRPISHIGARYAGLFP